MWALRGGPRCCAAILMGRPSPSASWRAASAFGAVGGSSSSSSCALATASAARRARAARATKAAANAASGPAPSPSTSSPPPPSPPPPLPPTLDLGLPPASNAKVRTAVYRGSAVRLEDCPPEDPKRPEVAVIGRSNVGKSSLVNALTGSKGLAMVSKSPGKTRTINHFLVNDAWWLVDLPGYGYAKTAKTTREAFDAFARDFLSRRRSLAMVLLLVDASVPPQRVDLEYAAWLAGSGVPFAVVFTKTDKRPKKKGSGVVCGGGGSTAAGGGGGARGEDEAAGEDEEEEEEQEEQEEQPPQEQQQQGRSAPAVPRAALASPHALAFLRALATEQGFRLLPPSLATSAATGAGTGEVLRFVASVRLGFLQVRKAAREEAQRRAMEAEEEEEEAEEKERVAEEEERARGDDDGSGRAR